MGKNWKKQLEDIDSSLERIKRLEDETDLSLAGLKEHYYIKRVRLAEKIGKSSSKNNH